VKRCLYGALVVSVCIALWWIAAAIANSVLLPTPDKALQGMLSILGSTSGLKHIWITTCRVLVGMAIGATFGIILGVATRYSRFIEAVVRLVIYPVIHSVPTLCWVMIFALWFGYSNITPVLTIAVSVAPFFVINIWEGMKELDLSLVEMSEMYTRKRMLVLGKVIMPMLYPYVFAATRSAFMTAWKAAIPAEIFGAGSGMGYEISNAFGGYRFAQVFGWTLIFAFILISFDNGLFRYFDRKYIRKWKPVGK